VSADAGWIAVQGPASGQGDATIPYGVQANPAPAARSGSIVVSSERLTVSQAAAPCRFTLSRTGDPIGPAGGRLSVGITTLTGCAWTASSAAGWIAVASGQKGSASGTVVLAVAANDGAARVGSVNVGGQNYTVTQAAAPTVPSEPPPPSAPPPPSPPPATVDFSGSISNVSGECPDVSFQVKSLAVVTSAATLYDHGRCRDLRNKARVSGAGLAQPDGSILAASITFGRD
jgi:hypothetical protein